MKIEQQQGEQKSCAAAVCMDMNVRRKRLVWWVMVVEELKYMMTQLTERINKLENANDCQHVET